MLRFTQRARRVLSHAQVEAEQRRARMLDTDHLLLGLLREEGCVAALALKRLGIAPQQVAALLPGEAEASSRPPQSLDLAPDVKTALEGAVDVARRLGHTCIGSEHLLLALSKMERSRAVHILRQLGLSATQIESEIKRLLTSAPPGSMQVVRRRTHQPPPDQKERQQANLVYERLSCRSAWPSVNLTALFSFVGFFLSSVFIYAVEPILMARAWTVWMGMLVHIVSALAALMAPPAAAVISAMLTARDVQEGAQQMLALTGLSPRAIVRGYIRAMMYRLRLLFALMLALAPLYVSAGVWLLWFRYPPPVLGSISPIVYDASGSLLTLGGAVLACTWLGTALGTALALRTGSGVTAGIVAALLVMAVRAGLLGLLAGAAQIVWGGPLIRLITPLLPALLGLLVMRQAERWIPQRR